MFGALIGAGAGLLGGLLQNSAGQKAADKQMAFQKETLKHQYQWGMEDMRKAGLNPILAYKQGGAGSASGSSYTPQNVGSAAVQGASTAQSSSLQTRQMNATLDNIAADTQLKKSQDATQVAQQLVHRMQAAQAAAQTAKTTQETDILGLNVASAKAAAAQALTDYQFHNSEAGRILRLWELGAGKALGPASNLPALIGLGRAKGSPKQGRSGPTSHNSSSHYKKRVFDKMENKN